MLSSIKAHEVIGLENVSLQGTSERHKESVLQCKLFIINLNRATERWQRVCEILDKEGVDYERIEAIDGQREEAVCEANTEFPVPYSKWFRPLTRGEVACSLSHRKAWQRIVELGLPYALILEDDFILQANDWQLALNRVLASQQTFDLVKLSRAEEDKLTKVKPLTDKYYLAKSYPIPIDAVATLVSKQGATKLLDGIKKIHRPVDFEFKNYWEYDLQLYSIYPNLFTQVELEVMDSYIGNRAQYRDYPLLKRIAIYLRKYVYQVIHRWRLTKYKLLLK